MVGIRSCGAYVPVYRLSREEIGRAMGGYAMAGERSVANVDEDSITMAVESARNALNGVDRSEIDALFFASTSAPYKEKQSASTITLGADLNEGIMTSDIANSIGAGASAINLAMDRVKSGSARNILIAASDCRPATGGSDFEQSFGDGAGAIIISNEDLIAEFEGGYSITDDFIGVWRTSEDKFDRSWEDRFVKLEGYQKNVTAAVNGLFNKYKMGPSDFQKVVLPAPDQRSLKAVSRALGFDFKTQVQDPLFATVGDTGASHPLVILTACLESAKPNDKILFVSYGDGAQALIFTVTDKIENFKNRRRVEDCIEDRISLANYEEYLKLKNLIVTEAARRPAYPSSSPYMWRERNYFVRLHGSKCLNCGTEQYPRHRVCYECKTKDKFEEIELAGRKGSVITYTKDYLFPATLPPSVQATVELDGGCRLYMMVADIKPDDMKSRMPVEMTFRMLHDRAGFYHYGWKARPFKVRRDL